MNQAAGWLSGLGSGSILMYFLDPDRGKRRRALVRDQIVHCLNKTGDGVGTTRRDAAHRVQGLAATARRRLRTPDVSDGRLEARVRSKLGRVVSHPHAVSVTASDGHVTLSGPILASEAGPLLRAVRKVSGVTAVIDQLDVHKQPESVPGLQGGAGRRVEQPLDVLQRNWAPTTRLMVGAAGCGLVGYGVVRRDWPGVLFSAAGSLIFARALTNMETGRLVGVGAGRRAVEFQKTIYIDAPVDVVFAFWRNIEDFPRFMTNVREVRRTNVEGQSHWTISGPGGIPIEFDAVVTQFIPNQVLAWKTVEGATVGHAGIVRFEPAGERGTRLQIRMSYNPPAGVIGHSVAWLAGATAKTKMDEDLVRMKTLVETGRRPHDAAQPTSEMTLR
jgi:uncharacterized membrane protein